MKKRFVVGFLHPCLLLVCLLFVCLVLSACNSLPPPDTEKPEVTLSGEASRVTTNSSVTLEGNLAPDVVKFVYRLNGGEPQDVTASISEGVFSLVIENLPPGTNTVIFEATDGAGNVTVSEPVTLIVVDLTGVWGSHNSFFELCGTSTDGRVLVFNLEQTPSGLTGTVTTGFGGDYNKGTLAGAVNEENMLEAQVTFPSPVEGIPSATGTLLFKVEAGGLTGELVYQDGQTCSENDETLAPTLVSGTLLKGVDMPPLPPDDALEPNDTQSSATAITLPHESPPELVLLRDNPDWYRLELSASSVLTLSITTEQNLAGFTLQLYDAQGAIDEPRFSRKEPGQVLDYQTDWGLAAGTYYLQVIGSPYFKEAAMPYSFSLTAVPTPDALFEPNDTVDKAYVIDTLPFSEEIYLQSGDEDWFRFVVPRLPRNQMNVLSFSGISFPGMTLYSTKLDAQDEIIPDQVIYKDDDFFFELEGLAAGTYYLSVKESGSVGAFTLAFDVKPVPKPSPQPRPPKP